MWSLKNSQLVWPRQPTASIEVTAEVASELGTRQTHQAHANFPMPSFLPREKLFAEATMEKGENLEPSITSSCVLWQRGAGNRESKSLIPSRFKPTREFAHRRKVPATSKIRSEIKSQKYAKLGKHELRRIQL